MAQTPNNKMKKGFKSNLADGQGPQNTEYVTNTTPEEAKEFLPGENVLQ